MADHGPATYSIREVAKLLGLGLNQCYRAAHSGALAPIAIRVGRRIVIPREALRRLLAGEPTPSLVNREAGGSGVGSFDRAD